MGGSSSKSKQTITNTTVNQNFMDTLNKSIMNSSVETMIKNASSCSSAVNVNNSCDISGATIGGDFTFGGNQSATADVNFNCIQANQTSNDMSSAMMNTMIAEMQSLNGTDAASNLNTASQSSNKNGFASIPIGSSKANSKSNQINNVTNETINNIENIFEHNLSNNFSAETVNECIGKTNVSNSQDLSNIDVGGNANIECIQTASVKQVQSCEQLSEAIQKTTQETFNELGLIVETQSLTEAATESSASSKSENIATGPIEEIGNVIGNLFSMFGLAFLGPVGGSICLCCCCCCCLIILIILFFFISSNMETSDINEMGGLSGISGLNNISEMTDMAGFNNISNTGMYN
jgi:hypothetical protein